MSFFDGYNVATSGMSAQRTRINIVSANIANAQTTHTENGGPYKKQNVIFEEVLLKSQKGTDKSGTNSSISGAQSNLRGVGIKEIVDSQNQPLLKYEPNHPEANADGYVAYPDINPVIEMVDMIEAMRSYESNVASFQTQKNMDTKTLDLLK